MTKKMIDTTDATLLEGVVVYVPSRIRDEKGLWQVKIPSGGMTELKLLGRAAPDAPWHEIVKETPGDMGFNTTNTTLVDLFPEMSVSLTGNSTAITVEGWLVD